MKLRPSRAGWVALACMCALLAVRVGWGASRDAVDRMNRGNLARSVYLMAWLYAEEHDHVLPEMDTRAGTLAYSTDDMHPAYAIDQKLAGPLKDPKAPLLVGDLDGYKAYTMRPMANPADYYYLGYALSDEAAVTAFVDACRQRLASGQRFDSDLPASPGRGSFGGDTFVRLRNDLAQTLKDKGVSAEEAARQISRIPALIEKPKNGPKPGGWVIYLDRRAEYLPYPGPYPMTEKVLKGLESLKRPLRP